MSLVAATAGSSWWQLRKKSRTGGSCNLGGRSSSGTRHLSSGSGSSADGAVVSTRSVLVPEVDERVMETGFAQV